MRIGIDLMGSDSSPEILFKAVLLASEQLKGITFIVFTTQSVVNLLWSNSNFSHLLQTTPSRVIFHVVPDVIEMTDEPLVAIRQKKHSSLVSGIRLLKKRSIDAFVTAGNTGALIASVALSLPFLPGMKRPALLATLPTKKGYVAVIDVGGNVSCKSHHLVQFAQIGAAYQYCVQGIKVPTIGLLNIGVESKKGTSEIRQAYQILQNKFSENSQDQRMKFLGNVEGREVFQGKIDVLVTDGFTGNVLLKTCEGTSSFILEHLKENLGPIPQDQKEAILKDLYYHFDYDEYPGAVVCGIDSIVIKCHGKSTSKGFLNGIIGAAELVQNNFLSQIKSQVAPLNPTTSSIKQSNWNI